MEGQHGDEEARARYEQTYGIHVQSKPNDRKKQHCDDPTVQDAKKDMHSAGSRTSGGASRSQGGSARKSSPSARSRTYLRGNFVRHPSRAGHHGAPWEQTP